MADGRKLDTWSVTPRDHRHLPHHPTPIILGVGAFSFPFFFLYFFFLLYIFPPSLPISSPPPVTRWPVHRPPPSTPDLVWERSNFFFFLRERERPPPKRKTSSNREREEGANKLKKKTWIRSHEAPPPQLEIFVCTWASI